MSEDIIIDDVNVAECRHLSFVEEDYCCNCQYEKYALCKNSDCYYKQLQQAKAENKELKHYLACMTEQRNKAETENERLKKRLIGIDKDGKYYYIDDTYRKALEEIREDLEQDTTCESRECGCDDYEECLKCVKETILDKISEVLK